MRRRTPISLALSAFFLTAATANAQYDIKPGLFNWWRSTARDGVSYFSVDQAGTNNSAIIEGSPVTPIPPMPMSGPPPGFYCFPKVTDSMTVANHPDIDIGSEDFTIKGTFSLDKDAQPQSVVTILDKRDVMNGRYGGYAVFLYNDRFAFQMANRVEGTIGAKNYFAPAAGNYRDGERHTFVVSVKREANGGRIWVDGNLVLTFAPLTGSLFADAPLRFARHALDASGPLLGCLYEIQMYRYVAYTWNDLDHLRIWGRAEEGAWFRFDEGASDYAFDSSGTMENPRRAKDKPSVCEGRVRGGALFTTDVLLRLPTSPTLNLGTGDFTMAVWVRIPAGTTGVRNIVHNRSAGKGYALTFVDGAVQFEMNGVKVSAAPPSGTLANGQWYLIGVAVRRSGGPPLGRLAVLSDNPAIPPVEKTFTPDMATLDTGQNVAIAGSFRGCLDELMIFKDSWRNDDYFGRLRKQATDSTGYQQLYYGFW